MKPNEMPWELPTNVKTRRHDADVIISVHHSNTKKSRISIRFKKEAIEKIGKDRIAAAKVHGRVYFMRRSDGFHVTFGKTETSRAQFSFYPEKMSDWEHLAGCGYTLEYDEEAGLYFICVL